MKQSGYDPFAEVKVGDTVRLRWGKRIALVAGVFAGQMVRLDRQLGGQTLWNRNDLVVVPKG